MADDHLPVLYGVERLLVRDVIHEYEAHGAPVVGGGDSSVSLLARRVLSTKKINTELADSMEWRKLRTLASTYPYLQLHSLLVPEDCLNFEVDADGADERRGE